MKKAIFVGLLAVTTLVGADEGWSTITSTDEMVFDGQNRSYYEVKTHGGELAGVLVGRMTSSTDKTANVVLEKWYVTMKDCTKKMGHLTSTDVNGTFKNDTDFVLGSGTVASKIAEMICAIHDSDVAEARAKSL